jgi:hypothetical protein
MRDSLLLLFRNATEAFKTPVAWVSRVLYVRRVLRSRTAASYIPFDQGYRTSSVCAATLAYLVHVNMALHS